MRELALKIAEHPELSTMLGRLSSPVRQLVIGLPTAARASLITAVSEIKGRAVLVVCENETPLQLLFTDLEVFLGYPPVVYPERSLTFYPVEGASREWEHKRIEALYAISSEKTPIVLTTVAALTQLTIPPSYVTNLTVRLRVGDEYSPDELALRLTRSGYIRTEMVEGAGQFALRGGILDVFPPASPQPIRMEFFGDEVDSLSRFDILSQRRVENIKEVSLLPACELLPQADDITLARLRVGIEGLISAAMKDERRPPKLLETLYADLERLGNTGSIPAIDRYASLIYPEFTSIIDFLPENTVVFFEESHRLFEYGRTLAWQRGEDITSMLETGVITAKQSGIYQTFVQTYNRLLSHPVIAMDILYSSNPDFHASSVINVQARHLSMPVFQLENIAPDLTHYTAAGFAVLFLCASNIRCENLEMLLRESGFDVSIATDGKLPDAGRILISVGTLSSGFEYPALKFAVLTEGGKTAGRRKTAARRANRLYSFNDLHPGDLVVHDAHGIGRFDGLSKITVDGIVKDFIKISYSGSDVLFIPVTQLDVISRYIGAREDSNLKLNKLGGTEWARSRTSAKAAAKDLARDLIVLYASRKNIEGHAFPPDTPWQSEFEQSFEYEETDDQLKCTEEIKRDMESPSPMDRLLCGDVGFGKTEVAFRAIMKCIFGSKQAAVLVPTTLLARQHHMTATNRFSGYPVRIETLTRYTTAPQSKRILQGLADGSVDLVIGTHKLLQKNIKFKDLGLLVVDEEQRFGVSHKERLKDICKSVDVLTLTATPIPRTLNMALSGIRDMSLMEEAPADRHPVQTYVLEHNYDIMADVIRREIARGGQVFYLHNHIDSIDQAAGRLRRLLPEATIAVAHGRMAENNIGAVMNDMLNGTINVLVCTTIIEIGIDLPNVNTLIIDHADRLGLAQLHQIRGRVGRSPRRAFAYLTYRPDRILTEVAAKRLSAIREFAEFGAGFKIALRDLEIRGTGNLLGAEQSGHMSDVGYDMYLKLLEEAIREEKGEDTPAVFSCSADLSIDAHIPERYIPSSSERVDIYRRIAAIASGEPPDDVLDELIDRYGDPPEEVLRLIDIAGLRLAAANVGITDITQKAAQLNFTFVKPPLKVISKLYTLPEYRGRLMLNAGNHPYLGLRLRNEPPLEAAKALVVALNIHGEKPEVNK